MKILILSAASNSEATKSIVKAGTNRKHDMIVLDPSYLYLLISDVVSGYDRLYDGYNADNKPVRIKAKEIDAIIPRIGNNLLYGASVLQHINENLGIFSTQTADGILTAANKLTSLQRISAHSVRVPKTVMADEFTHLDWMLEQIGGLPCIAKMLYGSQGIGVIPLESKLQTNATLQSFYKSKTKILLQQYIDSGAKDIRAIVIDNNVVVAMERSSNNDDIRANLSRGGSGKKIELSKEDREMCVKAANAVGLEVAGVDLMKHSKTGTSYIIEVNGNYGYKVEEITKTDISTPLIEMCEKYYKKGNTHNEEFRNRQLAISSILNTFENGK